MAATFDTSAEEFSPSAGGLTAARSRSRTMMAIRLVCRELRSTSSAPRRRSGSSTARATRLLAAKIGSIRAVYPSNTSDTVVMFSRFRTPGAVSTAFRRSSSPDMPSSAGP